MAVPGGSTSPVPIPDPGVLAEVVEPAPVNFSDALTITVPGAAGQTYSNVNWVPKWEHESAAKVKAVLPKAASGTEPGDQCLAVFDDTGAPWIVCWINS